MKRREKRKRKGERKNKKVHKKSVLTDSCACDSNSYLVNMNFPSVREESEG